MDMFCLGITNENANATYRYKSPCYLLSVPKGEQFKSRLFFNLRKLGDILSAPTFLIMTNGKFKTGTKGQRLNISSGILRGELPI